MLKEHLNVKAPTTLYHYTTQAGFQGIIGKREIWATSAHFLNDAKEFKYALELLVNRAKEKYPNSKKLKKLIDDLWQISEINVCVTSFSTKGDLLSQWRGYGQGGSGYSIGFHGEKIRTLAESKNFILCPVIYKYEYQVSLVDEIIDRWLVDDHVFKGILPRLDNEKDFADYISMLAPIIKHPTFSEEAEWRLISPPLDCDIERFDFRPGRYSLIPYYRVPLENGEIKFPPKHIYVGPSPEQQLSLSAAQLYLVSQGLNKVSIERSEIPYRGW